MKRPNIVLTIADDQRGTALGCAGVEPVQTPHLDALAARGVRCSQAYHYGSCHGAVCAPSRAMLHTGLRYHDLDPLLLSPTYAPPGQTVRIPATLGYKLRQAGYETFGTGKWHNGVDSYFQSFSSGATEFFGGMADHYFTPVQEYDSTGQFPAERARMRPGHSTEIFGQSAVDFIHSRKNNDQPFFCYCAFTAPHDPRTPPDAFRQLYDPMQMKLPPNFVAQHPFNNGQLGGRDETLIGHPRDPKEVQRSTAEYYGMISHMDEWIGRIHAALADIGERDNTVVVHTADHGLNLGQHGLMGKQNVYEASIRVPLIIAGPEWPSGQVRAGLCYQHDLHPTLLQAAGVPTGEVFFQPLQPLLNGTANGREHLVSHYRQWQRTVRDARYKLIEYQVDGVKSEQLFDLHADPWETKSLHADAAQAERLATLRKQLPSEHLPLR